MDIGSITTLEGINLNSQIRGRQKSILDFSSDSTLGIKRDLSSTFVNNMSLPVHRWFRYSAGFSAEWVESIIEKYKENRDLCVFDPFVGSGTVLLASQKKGVNSKGVESHPFVARIAQAKLQWNTNIEKFQEVSKSVLNNAMSLKGSTEGYPPLIIKCFSKDTLEKLDSLKKALEKNKQESAEYELNWLTLTAILRQVSPVGTAQWQYILPNKTKKKVLEPFEAFKKQIKQMVEDMVWMQRNATTQSAEFIKGDIRNCKKVPKNWADLIITSPPYANNYDYADAMRLELSFFGEISSYSDLQHKVRKHLICSCTQHVSGLTESWEDLLNSEYLKPIQEDITKVCVTLEKERLLHGGKKNYHIMVASYFYDLAQTWFELRNICKPESKVCFVIGDSAPYGVHIPVEQWLGRLAIAAGFKQYRFEKTRDRNIKWKNRKHRVPLQEGHLWIEG